MDEATDSITVPAERAAQIARGVTRFLFDQGNACFREFTFTTGRRADIIALDRKGIITVVEVKSSLADFRSDVKWQEYLEFCDLFYFAVSKEFPNDALPDDCGF